MRQAILRSGSTGLTLVVKKVKGRLYVYEQYRLDGRVVTRYIGPLEEMALIYQSYRAGLTVNYKPRRGDYKRLAKYIVEDVVNRLQKQWCGGRDLNPRRPAPADLESAPIPGSGPPGKPGVNYTLLKAPVDNGLIQKFYKWCTETRGTSPETCKDYANALRKPLDPKIRVRVVARRLLLQMLGVRPPEWLRVPRSSMDKYVPPLEEVLETVKGAEEPYRTVYLVLLQSGLRLREACRLLARIDRLNVVRVPGMDSFVRVELDWRRGAKQAIWAYLLHEPPKLRVDASAVSKYAERHGLLPPKYIRKFVATQMRKLGLQPDTIDFIQGRVPQKVLGKHYLDLLAVADLEYPAYAQWLRQTLAQHGLLQGGGMSK